MSSGAHKRRKGVTGEREVKTLFSSHAWTMRGLEGEGDHLASKLQSQRSHSPGLVVLHVESKRQERLALPMWTRQAEAEAPAGTTPVVCYRTSREPWRVVLRLDQFLELLG